MWTNMANVVVNKDEYVLDDGRREPSVYRNRLQQPSGRPTEDEQG